MNKGIVIASDLHTEWLLPWWWNNYRAENSYPVIVVDLGMSNQGLSWSQQIGTIIPFRDKIKVAARSKIAPSKIDKWEKEYGANLWRARKQWFKKPLAMLYSPFDISIWLDLDCEVSASLEPLFTAVTPLQQFGIVRESDLIVKKPIYNSGVIVYHRGAKIIDEWVKGCLSKNRQYIGDQQLLSQLLWKDRSSFVELPIHFNWMMMRGYNQKAIVAHWANNWGKLYINVLGGIRENIAFIASC